MPSLTKHLTALATLKPAFWIGTLLSCAVGLVFYFTTADTIEKEAQVRFNNMANSVKSTLDGRVKSYTDVLRGSASLFQTSTNLTREQFHLYVDGLSLEHEFPGIVSINFARFVTDAERPAFEESMRKEIAGIASGYPVFKIFPPGRRSSYTVLTYIEPISAWANRFGIDIAALGSVSTLEAARDSGHISGSGSPITPLSGPLRPVLSMRIPIYRSNMRAVSVEERRAAYIGSVGVGFHIDKLMRDVVDQMPVHGVRVSLSDVTVLPPNAKPEARFQRLLFDNQTTAAAPPKDAQVADRDSFIVTLPMASTIRTWQLRFTINKGNLYTKFDAYVPWLAMLAGFGSTILIYTLLHTLTSSRRSAIALAEGMTKELRASEAQLKISNDNLRRLAAHADNIKEGERKRIAREIHDELGQNLLVLRIDADMLSARTSGHRHPHLHARARATLEQIDATIRSVRQIINDLRPTVLDLGLNAAVDWQITDFQRRTGIECELIENHQDIQISDHCATALFRILQESLSNISRHAQATQLWVELHIEGDRMSMTVSDNGVGLHPRGRQKPGSFGLVGIEERINILGGTFAIRSTPGTGTTVHVSVPTHDYIAEPKPLCDAHAGGVALA